MPTYVVTGASRGLGYEFIRQFSEYPNSTVYGLVRDKETTEQRIKKDGLKNIRILQADITDRDALNKAVTEIGKAGHGVDYLINNAAYMSGDTVERALSDYGDNPGNLEDELLRSFRANVVGVINTINAFLPLIQQGKAKKVVALTTGLADDNLTNQFEIFEHAPYSISKAALNTVVAKYNAKFQKEGILFFGISPGVVDTFTEGAPKEYGEMGQKFLKAYPHFTGPITPAESVEMMMKVVERASSTNEFAGAFVSHYGTKQWI